MYGLSKQGTSVFLHHQLCNALLGWERLVGHKMFQNLIGHSTFTEFADYNDMRATFERLRFDFDMEGEAKTVARLDAYLTYFDVAYEGKDIPLDEYYSRVTGLAFEPFADEQIMSIQKLLRNAFTQIGVDYDRADEQLDRIEIRRHETGYLQAIRDLLADDEQDLKSLTGHEIKFGYKVEMEDLNPFTAGGCDWEDGEFLIIFNATGGERSSLIKSGMTARHEWGHCFQNSLIAKRVKDKTIPRSMGLLSARSLFIVHAEGLADSIASLAPALTGLEKAHHLYSEYARMVTFNASVMQEREGLRKAGPYLEAMAPMIKRDYVTAILKATRGPDPNIPWLLAYAQPCHAFNALARAIGREAYGKFIGGTATEWKTPAELNAAIRQTGHMHCQLKLAA